MALTVSLALLVWAGIVQAATSPPVPVAAQVEIVATYPHDTDAFTQGLFIHEDVLFESTGRVGQSSLRRVDLESGVIEQIAAIDPPYFGEGSTRVGDEIFMLSWRSQTGFVFDADTFELIDTFSYPGEGWGLAYDGRHLILSDGSAQLRRLDPETLELAGTLDVTLNGRPVRRLNELEWVDGEIWANVWETRLIARIDPDSGAVIGLVDLANALPAELAGDREAVANGIAWNPRTDQIYVTGKLWPHLYEIRVLPPANRS